jgi:hypothetical protein
MPTLIILTPLCLPYTPSINYAHFPVDFVNSSTDCGNTFANYTDFFLTLLKKLMIVKIRLMIKQIFMLIQPIPLTNHL